MYMLLDNSDARQNKLIFVIPFAKPKTKPHLLTKSAPEINQSKIWSALDQDTDEHSDRDSSPSPNNPPPSPINFRPSIEGFVVGGKKLSCPDRAKSSINTSYEVGVSYFFHCVKT